jgi:ATP-dependent Lon protease
MILLLTQKNHEVADPQDDDIYKIGTVGIIIRMLKVPDGRMRILVQAISRAKAIVFKDLNTHFKAKIEKLEDEELKRHSVKNKALIKSVRESFNLIGRLEKQIPEEIFVIAENIKEAGKLSDIIAANLSVKVEESQKILNEQNGIKRLSKVFDILKYQLEIVKVQKQIYSEAQGEMDKSQKEYFLRQQLKAIKKELNEGSDGSEEVREYSLKLKRLKASKEVKKEVRKNIERLDKMHPESAESTVVRNYLDWMMDIPWQKSTKDNLDLRRAEKVLNDDHYGLDKVKERILEYLSVKKLATDSHSPIICFVGPPGVGKTSLGRSIARALSKKFVRVSLGGVRDEAEIRGHRRTYIGSMPGKIIQELKKVGTNNPVFMMDEVDKIGADFRGDPSSALLEVLDPEQNNKFQDHYLGVPFNLSDVFFITTANELEPIQPAFLDRMEVIHIHGYHLEEKLEIAKKYLLPRQIKKTGLKKKNIRFADSVIKCIAINYTREAGVRNLERELGSVCRKVARKVAIGEDKLFRINTKNISDYLGPKKLFNDQMLEKNSIGVATGMAWTQYGGDILFIEIKLFPGKGELILTGSLGDVMKESAMAALTFLKSNMKKLSLNQEVFENNNIHIHVPEGGTPKDGPSAGVTLTTALCSAFLKIPVNRKISMTGEITLRGKVLPVGGIKEKILAARRAGISKIVLPEKNRNDLIDIKKEYLEGMEFIFAERIEDVVNSTLMKKIF